MSGFATHRFCVAPMMDWTDRHCRYFHRLLTRRAMLYTEMVTTNAILFGDAAQHLAFDESEHPVALQLGGSDINGLARCAELAERFGYDEVNLNCGCPSDRVQEARFGACMMLEPQRVAQSVRAMQDATALPVTVKCRIGVDDSQEYEFLRRFIDIVSAAGCRTFIVHARKAWLRGLSPKENREIPPLRYEVVYRLKQEFPQLEIIINGGIRSIEECETHLNEVDGVMLGREAYENPWMLTEVDQRLYFDPGEFGDAGREQVNAVLRRYIERELADGAQLGHISRHILGLYRGLPGGRAFRRVLSEGAARDGGIGVFDAALAQVSFHSMQQAA